MNLDTYKALLSTDVSDAMDVGYAMDIGIHSLWTPTPKIMGFAYTVKCVNMSNTYLHDAIYQAPQGSVVVVEADANNYAIAGGNVCQVAKDNGIAGFVIDGVIRDIAEVRDCQFPVFARGVFPKPGNKTKHGSCQETITCGSVTVNDGDLIVADEEGIVVVPKQDMPSILDNALEKQKKASEQSLSQWREKHEAKIKQVLR